LPLWQTGISRGYERVKGYPSGPIGLSLSRINSQRMRPRIAGTP
jgi:hypothetical protein